MLHAKDHSRIKEVWYCAEENKPVDRKQIVKGYEYSKGEYVVVTDEELKKIAPRTAQTMEILQFVKVDEVDPIFFDKSYYLVPDEAVSKPYALLLKAMADTEYVAVAKLAMHSREHIVIIRPTKDGLMLHTMYFEEELHKAKAGGKNVAKQFSAKEMDLAKKLIDTLASPFRPQEYEDEYKKNVERLIDQKRKGKSVTVVSQPAVKPVIDIMQALQQSLARSAKDKKAPSTTAKKAKPKRSRKAA
jgi:DNA end-binding protein Ku